MVKRVDAGNAYGMNAAIALPERNIILPRFEFPRWLRFPRGVSDERVTRMLAPLGGMLTPLGVSVAATNWWEAGGATGCVAAYRAKGAASLAAAQINLANPGTYDLTEFGSPSFGAGGITFTVASDKFLTGIVPEANWSGFIQVTNVVVTGEKHFGYGFGGNPSFGVYIRYSDGNTYYDNGIEASVPSLGVTSGNFGIAGDKAYRNGVDEGITLGSWSGTVGNVFIGTAPYTLVALAIYNTVLTAPQAASLAAAMAAL